MIVRKIAQITKASTIAIVSEAAPLKRFPIVEITANTALKTQVTCSNLIIKDFKVNPQ